MKEYKSRWAVFAMSLPIFIEIVLQMMIPNMDQFMLSHYSQDAVAAVGNDNMIVNMIILTLSVLSQAAIMTFVNLFGIAVITTKVYAYIISMISYLYSQAMAMDECGRGLVFFWRWHQGVWRRAVI
ncbi:hypothetical protein [uncultured Acidaminococcus sp.]|uniref:hypothetical protein n=1 Tax=uncultured Acidaminococcus sp. TaxID=352152 RepID=UPI002942C8B8|nr:hypothetical protein [uncultured Acidaminococcus sp.]